MKGIRAIAEEIFTKQRGAEIKTAPADSSPTRGVVEPTEAGQSKITFGQIKELFNLPGNCHSATKITVVPENARLDAEKTKEF